MMSEKSKKPGKIAAKIAVYAVFALYALWVVFPFLVILITSLSPQEELDATLHFLWFPSRLSFEGYRIVLIDDIYAPIEGLSSILTGFMNTLWQVVPPVLVGLFISGLSAYAFAKISFRGSNVLFMCLVATMMIPGAVLTIPSYLFYDAIHWTDGWAGILPLMVPGMFGSAGITFFLRQFFRGLPDELIEAARLDGLNDFSIYVRMVIPLSAPAFIAQGVFSFVGGYNNYQGPLLYLKDLPALAPLQISIQLFSGGYGNPAVLCAAVVVALLPLIILYCFLQKYFTQGIAMTGLKG